VIYYNILGEHIITKLGYTLSVQEKKYYYRQLLNGFVRERTKTFTLAGSKKQIIIQ
jgi:hypothetical protein